MSVGNEFQLVRCNVSGMKAGLEFLPCWQLSPKKFLEYYFYGSDTMWKSVMIILLKNTLLFILWKRKL